jgi:hypothetical protein
MLLHNSNYIQFLNSELPNNTFYTSLGDLPNKFSIIFKIFNKADELIYCPQEVWTDNKDVDAITFNNSLKGSTEYILFDFLHKKGNVKNLNLSKYINQSFSVLHDQRKHDGPQLWVAGGSDTFGNSVKIDERYGEVLGRKLGMPVSVLAEDAASMMWISDQIIRSDVRSGDLVVVGLVPDGRLPMWSTVKNKVLHTSLSFTGWQLVDVPESSINRFLASDTVFYEYVVHVYQIINFCRKIGAKLLILGLMCSARLAMQLSAVPEFKNYINQDSINNWKELIDFGADNVHAGPIQHQQYADFCYNQFKQLNYI